MSTGVRAALGVADTDVLVVGEVAQAHDGSLGTAHAYVDAIAAAGADAIKFQTHIAAAESTQAEPWRVPFSPQDASRYDYWERMEFRPEQWARLYEHARDVGLAFVCSPFSIEAVDLLRQSGVDALKIASGEVSNLELVDACSSVGVPVLLSSGLSPWAEIDDAVTHVRDAAIPFAVLQCSSAYPCPPEEIGLNLVAALGDRYSCESGISDHSGTIFPSLAAAAFGASVIEVHVTLSREAFGPDVTSSVTTAELRQLVDGVRFTATMLRHPVDKDDAASARGDLRAMFTRSLVARTTLAAGHTLVAGDLVAKKPGGGLPPAALDELVGRRIQRGLDADEAITEQDLEPAAATD